MSNPQKHKTQAEKNLKFLKSFYSDGTFPDWAVTVAFYTAVHIVEYAIFVSDSIKYADTPLNIQHSDELIHACERKNIPPLRGNDWASCGHHQRRILVVEYSFPEINSLYKMLHSQSRTARYKCFTWGKPNVTFLIEEVFDKIIEWGNDKWELGFGFVSKKHRKKEKKK